MTSPAHKKRIKRELVDRARLAARAGGRVATSKADGRPFHWIYIGAAHVQVYGDGYIRIGYVCKDNGWRLILTCAGKAYRFGRLQNTAYINTTLELLRSEMVLDDLAAV
jgi:hypothetical protein